jgi:tetratricopeptide (TPR) repeat protein
MQSGSRHVERRHRYNAEVACDLDLNVVKKYLENSFSVATPVSSKCRRRPIRNPLQRSSNPPSAVRIPCMKSVRGRGNSSSLGSTVADENVCHRRAWAGKRIGARKSFRDGLAIRGRLAQADPRNAGWQRDLSVSYNKVGDVLVDQGNLPEALKSFRDGLAIAERLAQADPGNAGWQFDLGISNERIGDVQVAQCDLAAAAKSYEAKRDIISRLAQADPGNAGWQRDLSVSYNKIGDVLVAQDNLPEALKSFRADLAIAERLAQADPGNAGWQRDLSVSYNNIGDVLVAQGNLPEALKAFHDGLAIRERLARADPGNAGWQFDFVVSHWKLAANGDDAPRRWAFIVTTLRKLKAENRLTPQLISRILLPRMI